MKSKIFALVLLTAILSLAFVSAAVTFDVTPSEITLSKTNPSETFVIENTGDEIATFTLPSVTVNGIPIILSENGIEITESFDLGMGLDKTITASIDTSDLTNTIGTFERTATINSKNADASLTSTQDIKFTVEGGDYCELGNKGDLDIDRVRFDNLGLGKDDEWYLTDEIEVKVRVENLNNNDDMDDVIVEWGLYNTETGEFVIDDEEDQFDIKDGDKEEITFTFTLDPDEFDEDDNENDFVFLIKAYSDDLGEDLHCNQHEETIRIIRDKHFVILDNIEFTETNPCGTIVDITAEVWNIGDNDEEDVFIRVTEDLLGIAETINVGDLDILDSKKISFDIKIPEDADEKTYVLKFDIYDEDEDIFENDDNDEASFSKILVVEGNCGAVTETQNVLITAELDSETPEAIAGRQVIIRATIRNTGDTKTDYVISIFGNSAWSSLGAIDPQTITLDPGESRDVSIFLDLDEDSVGDQEFTIKATYGEQSTEQRVALTVEEGVTQDAVVDHLKQNWFIYVIVIVNIILIIAIISVIRRIAGKPAM